MDRTKSVKNNDQKKLFFLVIFGIAFGYVEAAVVYDLRKLIDFHTNYIITNYKVYLNLGFISFVKPLHSVLANNSVNKVEVIRESATIIMLIAIAYIAGRNRRQRIGAFLIGFACWDIMYYVFLKILDNWPTSLMTKDVYFLIPVTWVGPVITPLVCSLCILIIGCWLFLCPSRNPRNVKTPTPQELV